MKNSQTVANMSGPQLMAALTEDTKIAVVRDILNEFTFDVDRFRSSRMLSSNIEIRRLELQAANNILLALGLDALP